MLGVVSSVCTYHYHETSLAMADLLHSNIYLLGFYKKNICEFLTLARSKRLTVANLTILIAA